MTERDYRAERLMGDAIILERAGQVMARRFTPDSPPVPFTLAVLTNAASELRIQAERRVREQSG